MTKIMLILMLCTSAADLASTEYGLAMGATEGNPLMANRALRITTSLAVPFIAYAVTRNRPRLGKWICIIHVGVHSAVAGRNIYVGVQVRWGKT